MQNTVWRHTIAVGVMVIVLVVVIMYYITPDVMDAAFSMARHRVLGFIQSVSGSRVAATVPGRSSEAVQGAPRFQVPQRASSPMRSRGRYRRSEPAELRTGPDPFRPYARRMRSSGIQFEVVQEHAPEVLGGLVFVALAMWLLSRGRRFSRLIFAKEARMAACLARAVRQMESF